MGKKLPPKRAAFVREYLKDFNGTQAAIRAGYAPKTADREGHRLLRSAEIQAAVAAVQRKVTERTEVTIDRIVQEYAAIAFARMDQYVDFDSGGVKIKASSSLSAKALAAILEVREHHTRDGAKMVSFKLHSKGDALEALGRHLGMFGDSLKIQKAVEEMLETVRARMPAEAYEHFYNALRAAMGFGEVASGAAAPTEGSADAGADTKLH